MFQSKILGTGSFHPKKVLTNDDLAKMVDTNDEWIFERTGIKERRISSQDPDGGEFPSDMAYGASVQAIENAGINKNEIDLILFATLTPDYRLPTTSTILQTRLGLTNKCGCLDIGAACSGWVYGVNMAHSMIQSGMYKNILVVGAEMLSSVVDWTDRASCILFGDAAGAVVIGRTPEGETSNVLATKLGADGNGREFFELPTGGSVYPVQDYDKHQMPCYMQMKGREMFKVATRTLAENSRFVAEQAGLTLDDIDWIVPHQANERIIETTAKLLKADMNKVILNIKNFANTSTATIPTAFHQAIEQGKIKRGDIILFTTFGAGLTSGATLLRY